VLGLLAAALGIRRHEDEKQRALARAYGFAVRVDSAGIALRDYHTTQIPKGVSRLKHLATRRNELEERGNLHTVLSTRDYRCDGLYTVCLWQKAESPPHPLAELGEALRKPRFTLYLGRRSCPPALPVLTRTVQAETLDSAFVRFDAEPAEEQRMFFEKMQLDRLTGGNACYWGDDATTSSTGLPILHTVPRHDEPLSRRRRQFAKRNEHYGRLKGG
jgi:CRISPR system Cascade subunit CasD